RHTHLKHDSSLVNSLLNNYNIISHKIYSIIICNRFKFNCLLHLSYLKNSNHFSKLLELFLYSTAEVSTETPSSANTSLVAVKAPITLGKPTYGIICIIHPTISSGVKPTERPVFTCIPICGLPCATSVVIVVNTFC